MVDLVLHNKQVKTIFNLLGDTENDITYSIGYSLAVSRELLFELVSFIDPKIALTENTIIKLQDYYEGDRGFTDIEIIGDKFHFIIEAKKGSTFPTNSQISKYAKRFTSSDNCRIIILNESRREWVESELSGFGNLPVEFVSYDDILHMAKKCMIKRKNKEKIICNELFKYLSEVVSMRDISSNEVFCVVLSTKKIEQTNLTWKDIVEKNSMYFYPIRKHWPAEPPTYMAFRYGNKLRSIHYVKKYEVCTDLQSKIHDLTPKPSFNSDKHYLLYLDSPFLPSHEVKNGNIYASKQIRFMLDTIFTSKTIQEARDVSKYRLNTSRKA